MYVDKSREYWCGWALAFYQWHSAMTFAEILKKITLGEILDLYPKYHEMDIMRFIEHIDTYPLLPREIRESPEMKLLWEFYVAGYSARELAEKYDLELDQHYI